MLRTILIAATFLMTGAAVAADASAGADVFKKCAACHSIGPGAKTKVGPELNGLVGRKAGAVGGFNYSAAMKNSGLTWDPPTLLTYLHGPRALVPGTKMTFAGLDSDDDIKNLIAYLSQFSADGTQSPAQ